MVSSAWPCGEQNAAALYSQNEIQAAIAKENYDNAHDARRMATMEKGYAQAPAGPYQPLVEIREGLGRGLKVLRGPALMA